MSRLIVELKNDVFAEVFQRNFRATPGTKAPDFVGPVLEFRIVGNTALQCDRCEFGQTRRLATAARVASLAMLNNVRRTPQSTDSANASYVTAIPFDAELKVLVGIKTSD